MNSRILSLQSMRLAASLAVFQYHLWHNYLNVTFLHPGTDFFIVLVGMVAALTESRHISQGNWGKYLGGRYLRLYVTFVPVFILYSISGRDPLSVEFVIKSFFFIPMNRPLLVGPTWMLATFLVFYWVFSLAFVFRRESAVIPIFSLWALACLIITIFNIKPPIFEKGFDIIFNIRNLEFVFGYFGGWLVRSRNISSYLGGRLFMFGLFGMILACWLLNSANFSDSVRVFLFGSFMTLIATGLAGMEQQGGWETVMKWTTHPWLVWLGGASYVLYLSHNMVLRIWDTLLPITIVQIPLIIMVVLVIAGAVYQFWEKPVLQLSRRKLWDI